MVIAEEVAMFSVRGMSQKLRRVSEDGGIDVLMTISEVIELARVHAEAETKNASLSDRTWTWRPNL